MKLTIAVDDISIPLPPMVTPDVRQRILEQVIELAARAGVDDLEIVVATALHRRMTSAEIRRMVGERVYRSFWPKALYNLDAEDTANMTVVGQTDHGETVQIQKRAAESDLIVYININLVAMDGGHKSVAVGLAGYESLKHHHNVNTMLHSKSYMDPREGHSAINDSVNRMGRLLDDNGVKIFQIETTMNAETFPSQLGFLNKREWEWSAKDQGLMAGAKKANDLAPPRVRREFFRRIEAPYKVTGVNAGEVEAVHERTIENLHRQQLVEVQGQSDIAIFGIPYIGPYNVNSVLNPILVHCLGLGYLFNMYRNQPIVREGGVAILFHPVPWEFNTIHHPSYIDFFEEVLAETTDPKQIEATFEERYARDPWYIHLYRTSHAYHGVHPFYMWYWGAHGRDHCGDVIFVGGEPKSVARLGYRRADSLRDALEMAKDTVGSGAVDHVFPRAADHDRGRAVMSARDELREMAKGFRWGRRPLVPRSAEPYTEPHEDAGFPTDWARSKAGVAARRVILRGGMLPIVSTELSLRVYGSDHLEDVPGPVIFYSNHSSHLDATLDHVHPARALAEEDRGRRGARLLLRRVVAPGIHRARVRGVPDRSRARRHDGDRQGARARRRRLVDRRVPGGNALARRAHAAVPSRGVAAGARARRRACAGRDHRGVPGDAEGPVVAAKRPASGDAPLRGGAVPRGGRDAPAPVRSDAAGRDAAVRRGPDRLVPRDSRVPSAARRLRSRAPSARPGGARGRVRGRSRGADAPAPGSRTMPRTGGERRRTTLVEEAIRQFGTEGYTGASLDSIATAVGVRKQTLLYYFPNKDALLEACLAAAGKRVAEEISSALEASTDPEEGAEAVIHAVYELAAEWPEFPMFIREAGRLGPNAFDRFGSSLEPLRVRAVGFLRGGDGERADPETGPGPVAVHAVHGRDRFPHRSERAGLVRRTRRCADLAQAARSRGGRAGPRGLGACIGLRARDNRTRWETGFVASS